MNFKELATARFSVRKFTDEAVSQADLDAIMTCVQLAPSPATGSLGSFSFSPPTRPRRKYASATTVLGLPPRRSMCSA